MSAVETLLGNPFAQSLGWALIHFVWQGALIASLYLIASVLLRRFTSGVRYAAACAAMLLMFIAPIATTLGRYWSAESGQSAVVVEPAVAPRTEITAAQSSDDRLVAARRSEIESAPAVQPNSARQWAADQLPRFIPWLLALWFGGVLSLSLRFAGGLVMVRRLKRAQRSVALALWEDKLKQLCRRLRLSRPVRLCESALVEVPTVIGSLKPVILIPSSALIGLTPDQLEALLAHELAHIRRYDYLVNLFQTAVETLLFYHPAVWWVSAQIRQEREHCCDDLAVATCGDVLMYARALTALEEMRATEPQLAVAASGGSLLVRIERLLRGRAPALYGIDSWLAGLIAVAAIAIVLAGTQTTLFSHDVQASAINDQTASTMPTTKTSAPAKPTEPRTPARPADPIEPAHPEDQPAIPAPPSPPDDPAAFQTKIEESRDYISEMAAVGLTNLSADDLRSLKMLAVTPDFVREMSALVPDKLTAGDVAGLKIHGVTSAFANEMKALGLPLNAEQLVAFRIHGVTTQFVDEMKSAGVDKLDPDSLVAFRIHGVTPEFVQQMKNFGFDGLSGDRLTAFKIHGVTPLFIQTMRSYIHGKLSADDLVSLRIHGVTPEVIKGLEIVEFSNLSANDLTAFTIHGVTPAFIKSVQDAGYPKATVGELTELRISGVTPEFIQMVRSRGFTDVTLHQLVELRRLNLVPSQKKTN
ncbi:MAG TPA: M56 family metallopeptidase [Blastocatellia bacterium]|nr:M56 family metallopeptidase [Blastocatellia bacterium]